jgi:hypothetical protein
LGEPLADPESGIFKKTLPWRHFCVAEKPPKIYSQS